MGFPWFLNLHLTLILSPLYLRRWRFQNVKSVWRDSTSSRNMLPKWNGEGACCREAFTTGKTSHDPRFHTKMPTVSILKWWWGKQVEALGISRSWSFIDGQRGMEFSFSKRWEIDLVYEHLDIHECSLFSPCSWLLPLSWTPTCGRTGLGLQW